MSLNLEIDNKVLFNKLKNYFFNNIRITLKTRDKIFIITNDDLFYEINIFNEKFLSFFLCDDNSIIELMIVKELSGKNIIDISYGFCHFFAWNDRKEVFFWISNGCGQLENGKRGDENTSMEVINALRHSSENSMPHRFHGKNQNKPELNVLLCNLNIVAVECGFWHSLALTKDGKAYAWGLTSTGGCIEEMAQLCPLKVDGFDGEKVVMISCGYRHSMALTESGRVFSWGENSYGQLGTENEIYREKPKLIEIKNASFKKISCGQRHSLLLSNDGVIYAFGDNRCGQIGNGNQEMQSEPIQLTHDKKFRDIASNFMEDISVSQSIDNYFYVWGKYGKEIHLTPFLTNCKSFDEVFSNYSHIQYKLNENVFSDLFFRDGYYESEFTVIGKELEQGCFGKVVKVKDKNENYFAINKVKPLDGYEKDFFREYINYRGNNQLESEFLAKQYDSWFENNRNNAELSLYITMEFCDKALKEVMTEIHSEFYRAEDKILSPIGYYLASGIFIEILKGVLYLHQNNIIHRDLNSSNILLKEEGNGEISVKITDFSLSVVREFTEQYQTRDKERQRYIAPEVMNSNTYCTKADIYSLGVILENLFKIDPTKDYKIDSGKDYVFSKKYNQVLEVFSRMTVRIPSKRPNCEVILEAQQSWALHENEFDIENELNSVFEFGLKGKYFLIHSILESKFITIKAKNISIKESSVLETLINYEHKPDINQKFLENNSVEQSKLLSTVKENNTKESINLEQFEKVVEVTLKAMELNPNHKELQKNSLVILYSEQILENLSYERYKCTKLVMDSLVNFKETDMNLMASVICSTHLMKLSIKEREVLCTNDIYINTLLNIINLFSNNDLIENTLSALVNLLVDSLNNCSKFLELKGLDVLFSLLETFNDYNNIEFRVLGILYNIVEFHQFRDKLLESKFISKLRNLMNNQKINVSFLAAGIFAHLFQNRQNNTDSKEILEELMNAILNWKTLDKDCVSFVSFSTFQTLVDSFASPAVQFWAIWTLHHFCSENPKEYCELILKEIGIEPLKALRETSKSEPIISLCEETLNIIYKE